jgi:P4 family phage/plasmid primase-like protien
LVSTAFPELVGKKIVDQSVYREGLFRTYLSSKSGEARSLIKCNELSDNFETIDTFVANVQDECELIERSQFKKPVVEIQAVVEELDIIEPVQHELTKVDKDVIKKFVHKNYGQKQRDIRDIVIDRDHNCIVVALDDLFCFNVDREHKSNHQYIIIDTYSSKQKCHDLDCKDFKHQEIKIDKFPKELNELILKCLKINRQELELIERAIEDCKTYITENFDEHVDAIEFDKQEMVFRGHATGGSMIKLKGKCPECNIEHQISDTGYCLRCKVCNSVFPKQQLIPVDDRFKNLNKFWMNYNQLVNNGTVNININNFYNGEEEFSCDIQLDQGIIKDKRLLKIINECLDGHKITKLAEVMYNIYKNYVYTGNDWYMFDNHKWTLDTKSLNFKRHVLELCNLFNKIKQHYETKKIDNDAIGIIKNIKSLVTKINKPQLKEDILRDAQIFYIDKYFFGKLNSKKHLVPFGNGVYDLLETTFRKTTKDDYINLTVGFKYDASVFNPEVHTFINQILPNQDVRNYVLKKMSECLNGDIPNTNFLMFIGDGANGKSQLLNLMKATMGELAEKVEVTLLTRKRNNANEANTEKIKLMNKRFAFLSEPEDGEKINIGLLKELTGSEEIVARGLYQEAMSFVMESKLFLACNELPEIKGEDTALWRRIRVIDFPSRFVDEPKETNEYKIDRTLPSRMREDVSWKQTFMNILIDYYYKDVKEPVEVKLKTNEYREDNNKILGWMEEHIKHQVGSRLLLKDVCCLYFYNQSKVSVKDKGKLKKELEKCFKTKYPTHNCECVRATVDGETFQGWFNFILIDHQ